MSRSLWKPHEFPGSGDLISDENCRLPGVRPEMRFFVSQQGGEKNCHRRIVISAASLSKADHLHVYSSLLAHDLQQPLPLHDNDYDELICIGVLAYIDDCQSLFKEFCRIVKPGGYITFSQRSDLFNTRHFLVRYDDG